jgi:hypothetical protein
MKRFLVFFFYFFCSFFVYAQLTNKQNIVLEARWFQGDLKKPEDQVKAFLQKGTVYMYDLRVGFIDSDSSYFSVSGRHPIFGLGLSVIYY